MVLIWLRSPSPRPRRDGAGATKEGTAVEAGMVTEAGTGWRWRHARWWRQARGGAEVTEDGSGG